MIDLILSRLGLVRRKHVANGLLYLRHWELALGEPFGDRQMMNAMTIANGKKPAPHPTEDEALLQFRVLDGPARIRK